MFLHPIPLIMAPSAYSIDYNKSPLLDSHLLILDRYLKLADLL